MAAPYINDLNPYICGNAVRDFVKWRYPKQTGDTWEMLRHRATFGPYVGERPSWAHGDLIIRYHAADRLFILAGGHFALQDREQFFNTPISREDANAFAA